MPNAIHWQKDLAVASFVQWFMVNVYASIARIKCSNLISKDTWQKEVYLVKTAL